MIDTTLALVANGASDTSIWLRTALTQYTTIIGVDGGLNALRAAGVTPDEALGDFDSCDAPENIPAHRFSRNKNETDLELALEKYLPKYGSAAVYGALGRRVDHELSNLLLLTRYPQTVAFYSAQSSCLAISTSYHATVDPQDAVGLFSLSSTPTIVTTNGLRWNLRKATLSERLYSISNLAPEGDFAIEVHSGVALFMVTKLHYGGSP